MNEWIDVNEKMPEEDGYYIVYNGAVGIWFFCDGGWDEMYITHWMPLPKPPKEKK